MAENITKYDLISDLHPLKKDWCICVKVFRTWKEIRGHFGVFRELILGDEMGMKIEATIPNHLMEKISDDVQDGESYVIRSFLVSKALDPIRKTNSKYHIDFNNTTIMRNVSSFTEISHFNFFKLEQVMEANVNHDVPYVDVVGVITKLGEIRSFQNEFTVDRWALENIYIKFIIRDIIGTDINCFAIEIYANEMLKRFKNKRDNVNYCVLKLWEVVKVDDEYQLTNGIGCSDILVDPDIEEMVNFKFEAQYSSVGDTRCKPYEDDWSYQMSFNDEYKSFIHKRF